MYYRNNVIGQLQNQHSIVMLVSQNLSAYMTRAQQYALGEFWKTTAWKLDRMRCEFVGVGCMLWL